MNDAARTCLDARDKFTLPRRAGGVVNILRGERLERGAAGAAEGAGDEQEAAGGRRDGRHTRARHRWAAMGWEGSHLREEVRVGPKRQGKDEEGET
jgi:hypothetical protein